MTDLHVSPLLLDALALNALDREASARVSAHLASCERCTAAIREGVELRDEFTRGALKRGVPERALRRQRVRRWAWLGLPTLAAAVVITLWFWPQRGDEGGLGDDLAIKGGATWHLFANRAGKTFTVRDRTELAAGDRIRFVVQPDGAKYLLVASVDGGGGVTVYYPYDGARSGAIGGERFELDGSIVLDDAPGPERIFAILSDTPVEATMVTESLRAIAAGGEDAIRMTRTLPLQVRGQLSLVFEKTRKP